MCSHVLPFAAYMAFIAVSAFTSSEPQTQEILWFYPLKITLVSILLMYYWKHYPELKEKQGLEIPEIFLSIGVGLLVYFAWIRMDFSWATQGEVSAAYNPYAAGPQLGLALAGIRLFGASVVVPIMEELFWRSFILRYIISPDFTKVKLGTFTPASFLITGILFGLEHHFWLADIMAGAAYTLLLYRTQNLWHCIIAHTVTNLALGFHVLITEEWFWW